MARFVRAFRYIGDVADQLANDGDRVGLYRGASPVPTPAVCAGSLRDKSPTAPRLRIERGDEPEACVPEIRASPRDRTPPRHRRLPISNENRHLLHSWVRAGTTP